MLPARTLSAHLLRDAAGFRHGIVAPVEYSPSSFADVAGIVNANIPGDGGDDGAAGGVGRTHDDATARAIGEALERYAAGAVPLPLRTRDELAGANVLAAGAFALFSEAQRQSPGFPWAAPEKDAFYTNTFSLLDNREVWVPHELVSLGGRTAKAAFPSTSSGLAAHPDRFAALLSALEELLERDALTVAWLNGVGGAEVALDARWRGSIVSLGGEVECFEITQAWNPHPVVVVCGQVPMRGKKRFALGASCRATRDAAIEKAWLEFVQGAIFAGFYANVRPDLAFTSGRDVREFPEHCLYYTLRPEEWDLLPIRRRRRPATTARDRSSSSTVQCVEHLVHALDRVGVRTFYRDLTTVDVASLGVSVVRVISPELALLHGDEQAPFLGGRMRDVDWRWPGLPPSDVPFPNPYPHPLG